MKNVEVNFEELERLAQFGGSDEGHDVSDRGIVSTSVAFSVAYCTAISKGVSTTISAVSAVTSLFSCNRTCGC